jgi:hypothetical protein
MTLFAFFAVFIMTWLNQGTLIQWDRDIKGSFEFEPAVYTAHVRF